MNLIRFNPARDLIRIRDDMDRIFHQVNFPLVGEEELPDVEWSPRMDISETENGYILTADLAGMNKDDIKITLQDDILTLRGERKSEVKEEGKTYHLCERAYGRFSRSFRLNSPVAKDKIEASFKEGVLTLTLPKAEEAKPREIEIKMN